MIFDMHGRPLPPGEVRRKAEAQLQDFIEKHKSKFEDWLRRHGPVRFPVKYNLEKQQWFWDEREADK